MVYRALENMEDAAEMVDNETVRRASCMRTGRCGAGAVGRLHGRAVD